MSPQKKGVTRLLLTERAIRDIAAIEAYSAERWGRKTATKYISEIEAGLQRLRENPALLREEPDFHRSLRFYRVKKHALVFDIQANALFLLTVIHGARDIPTLLSELQPTLAAETAMLHAKLQHKQRGEA